jgi:hypothetical protein
MLMGTCTCVRETCHGNGWGEREVGKAEPHSPQYMGMLVCRDGSEVSVDHASYGASEDGSRSRRGCRNK